MHFYIAGPMRGIHLFNFPAFDAAKKYLSMNGHSVISPADIDQMTGTGMRSLPHAEQRRKSFTATVKHFLSAMRSTC